MSDEERKDLPEDELPFEETEGPDMSDAPEDDLDDLDMSDAPPDDLDDMGLDDIDDSDEGLEFLNRDQLPEEDGFGPVDETSDDLDLPPAVGSPEEDAGAGTAAAASEMAAPRDADEAMVESDEPVERKRGTPIIMIGAAVVVIALAVWFFWPRGGEVPADGGSAVLTLDPDGPGAGRVTRPEQQSGDVDLEDELQEVVPEQPAGEDGRDAGHAVQEADAAGDEFTTTPATGGDESTPPVSMVAEGEPSTSGKWAIQLGSFNSKQNAERLADSYRARGYRMEVPAIRGSGGNATHKVWVAFFETRADAKAWAETNLSDVGDIYITHR